MVTGSALGACLVRVGKWLKEGKQKGAGIETGQTKDGRQKDKINGSGRNRVGKGESVNLRGDLTPVVSRPR